MSRIYRVRAGVAITVISAMFSLSAAHSTDGPEIDEHGNEVFHAELTHNISPVMPPNAQESGYCCVMLDIQKSGRVKNTEIIYCTSEIFRDVTERTAPKVTYYPRLVNGVEAESQDKLENFSYRLNDEFGALIKNAEGYPEFYDEDEHSSEHYCRRHIS